MNKDFSLKEKIDYARDLGRWIARERGRLGMSASALGNKVDAHRNTIQRWETGVSLPDAFQAHVLKCLFRKEAKP